MKWDLQANVRWKVPIPGKGWSSPIVHAGRIFLTTAVPSEEKPPQRQSLRALCLDAATGQILWDVEVFVKQLGPGETLNAKNSYASPTPITDGEHVFVHFGPDGTACLDRDGKRIWANDQLRYNPVHGAGGSPVFSGSRLVFHCDGAEDPFVVALQRDSGAVAWRTPRPPMASPRWSFATPLVIEVAGTRQLVSPAAQMVCSYDPASGQELWRVRYPNKWSIVPRPVFAHGLVFVCTGYRRPRRTAGDPADGVRRRDRFACRLADRQQRAAHPVAAGRGKRDLPGQRQRDRVVSRRRNRRAALAAPRGGNFSASPVHAAGRIYLLSEQGVCTVIAAGREYRELATNDLQEPALASCAVVDRALIVRTAQHLYRIE